MLFYTGLLFLVIAVSLDGFGVGVTYGMRRIHVPLFALLIIMLCSGVIVLLSMTIGNMLSVFISPHFAKVIGGCILIAIGIFSLVNIIYAKKNINKKDKQTSKEKGKYSIASVLKTPDKADIDSSGVISPNEALLLGIALALDAFGAGLGASIIGYSPVLTTISIACMSGIFVFCGLRIGLMISKVKKLQHLTFVPPFLLITLGVINIF